MRICVIGKFPPIQGGVSMRTYWSAHGLAARGHEVHVVTNAKEARSPFRMHMRMEDWRRCEAAYGAGSVTMHWTDPVDRSQSYIPMASPFVSKLAATAARAHSKRPFDVIFSHYMEPYGVAGHLAAEMTGLPHVVRMAGSDAGRLWHHPQLEALYDHVLRSAEVVVAFGTVVERAIQHGVAPDRIAFGGGFVVPEDLFVPEGPVLDPPVLRTEVESDPEFHDLFWGDFTADRPYFGVYGKLGEKKGSFALLAAMQRLKRKGLKIGLVALAHGQPSVEQGFRARARELDIADRVLQIPFLPHWRVPEFLRGCLAVCCLEQDFPIGFHSPIIPREALTCGACLVGSTEVIRKLPSYERLPHGYGCVAIEDVNDIEALSERLAAIVEDPQPAAAVGARGREFARALQRNAQFPQTLERIFEAAVARQRVSAAARGSADSSVAEASRFPLTRLVAAAIGQRSGHVDASGATASAERTPDLAWAHEVLAAVEQGIVDGKTRSLAQAVRVEITIAAAEDEGDKASRPEPGPLFRLRMRRWGMGDGDLAGLVPVRDSRLRIVEFDGDVSEYLGARTVGEFPAVVAPGPSYIVAFERSDGPRREPLLVDRLTARILMLCDGTRTASEIVGEMGHRASTPENASSLDWIESLFVSGLIWMRDTRLDPVVQKSLHGFADLSTDTGST